MVDHSHFGLEPFYSRYYDGDLAPLATVSQTTDCVTHARSMQAGQYTANSTVLYETAGQSV